jgi:hypothetical protein
VLSAAVPQMMQTIHFFFSYYCEFTQGPKLEVCLFLPSSTFAITILVQTKFWRTLPNIDLLVILLICRSRALQSVAAISRAEDSEVQP